jgi:hypothetical protein
MSKMSDEHLAFLLALEVERNDVSHRTASDVTAEAKIHLDHSQVRHVKAWVSAEIEQQQAMREQRDKLFYNAGRYAAGARDSVAESASKVIDALMAVED